MSGVLGLNIVGDRGYPDDLVLALIQKLNSAYCVVINNAMLATKAQHFTTVIYRRKLSLGEDSNNDDSAHMHSDPISFLHDRHTETPPGALLYLTNEPGRGTLKQLNDWTLACMEEAEKLGRQVVFFNFSMGTPEPEDWQELIPCLERAVEKGHVLGMHDYFGSDVTKSIPWYIGRWIPIRQQYPKLKIVVTEVGYDNLANGNQGHGWDGILSQEKYSALLADYAALIAPLTTAACIFSVPAWEAFGIQDAQLVQSNLAHINSAYPYKESNVSDRAALGEPVEGYIADLKSNLVNVRAEQDPASASLGVLYKGDKLTFRPTLTNVMFRYQWYAVEKPWVGWMADVAMPAPGQAEQPLLKLDVPYVSQLAADALAYNNDCGPASLLMLMRYALQQARIAYGIFPSVDDVSRHTKLAQKDQPLNLADLQVVAQNYGRPLRLLQGLTPDVIISYLKQNIPVGMLLKYGAFNPNDSFKDGHYAIAVGYSEHSFWVHDPYRGGASFQVSREALDSALKNTSAFASAPYQGFILA